MLTKEDLKAIEDLLDRKLDEKLDKKPEEKVRPVAREERNAALCVFKTNMLQIFPATDKSNDNICIM